MNPTSELRRDTPAWIAQIWISFVLAVTAAGVGIAYAPVDVWIKAYLGMAFLFALGSSFSLSKTIRDNHEGRKLLNRLTDAKTEKLLRDFEIDPQNPA